jgi:hypothetical protein
MQQTLLIYCLDGYNNIKSEITSFDTLTVQLQDIRQQSADLFSVPFSVDIVVEQKGTLSIGLADSTILCYTSADYKDMRTAVGDRSAEGEAVFYFGDYSVLSKKYLIPYDLALKVLAHWCMTGTLSEEVEWTYEIF